MNSETEYWKERARLAEAYITARNRHLNVGSKDSYEAVTKANVAWQALVNQKPPESDGWISVEERLPEDDITDRSTSANVFAICRGELMVMCRAFIPEGYGGYAWCNCYGKIDGDGEFDDNYGVTLWKPLPTLPKLVN